MHIPVLISVLIPPLLLGCAATQPELISGAKTEPIVSGSAAGWTLRPGPGRDTIVVNPEKQEFNIGETQYPDIIAARLWIVPIRELKARFLIVCVPPACSAAVKMPILLIDEKNRSSLAGSVLQRWEFKVDTGDMPGADPKVRNEGRLQPLRDFLFKNSDKDGIPELVSEDLWKQGGTVTYLRLTKHKTFIPVRRETYVYVCDHKHPNGDLVLTSHRSLLR
jgi:hypothetical protein